MNFIWTVYMVLFNSDITLLRKNGKRAYLRFRNEKRDFHFYVNLQRRFLWTKI